MKAPKRGPAWRRYLRFWGSNTPQDVEEELRFHLDMRTRDYVARGLSDSAARDAAVARLGSIDHARAQCLAIGRENERRARSGDVFERVATDIRFALRSFRRSPGWTSVAVATIAIGVGASTAVFSVVDRLLVHPVGYPNADRIVLVRRDVNIGATTHVWMAPNAEQLDAWRRSSRSIERFEPYARRDLSLTIDGDARPIHSATIDTGFLSLAGGFPVAGRRFSADDVAPNAPAVAMLAESFWRREFGGAHDVIGKTLSLATGGITIVGIMPAGVQLPDLAADPPDVWLPLVRAGEQRLAGVVARLRPGVRPDDAGRELDAVLHQSGLDVENPGASGTTTAITHPGDTLAFRRSLVMMSGAVALLLLVAAANVAHLLLARAAVRERELGVRFALGADRGRLVGQLLTESVVLSLLGGAAAFVVGVVALRLVAALRPASMTALSHVTVNHAVATIAALLTLSTGVAVGLLVGLRAVRRGLADALRSGGGIARATSRLRSVLVVSEIAFSATLLVGALLLVHTVLRLQSTRVGFDPRGLYGVTYSLNGLAFGSSAERADFTRRLISGARSLPGVTGVTRAHRVPPKSGYSFGTLETPEHPATTENVTTGGANYVAPNYFAVLGISFVAGREFDDASAQRNEVIVSEAFAKQLWPDGRPVGSRFRYADTSAVNPWWTVVGVTRDALMHGLLEDVATPTIYFPLDQSGGNDAATVIVRGRDGKDPTPAIRRLATEIRASVPAPTITHVSEALAESMAEPRFAMMVLTTFAGLGVLLAAIGLYGVISYSVERRTREIGIRMALGASRGVIARLVLGEGLRLSFVGVVLGLAGATGATRMLEAALHGVQRADLWSFTLGSAMLVGVSLLACVVPLMRAAAVDPLAAIRAD